MQCNKDEAIRAKEIAETKFSANDIAGAKKFASKAHGLFPGLEGIRQMLATFDVYISSGNKINGDPDWYGVLGVDPKAEDESVRKQYRKLALLLHPDKNKSIGADGAFKLVFEAWSLLSDQSKRTAYDLKRNAKPKAAAPPRPNTNGFDSTKVPKPNNAKSNNNNNTRPGQASAPHFRNEKLKTFRTVCHACKKQYEGMIFYLDHNVLCPHCREPFLSNGTSKSPRASPASWSAPQTQQQQHHDDHRHHNYGKQTPREKPFSRSAMARATSVVR